jgi:hypothetical protein
LWARSSASVGRGWDQLFDDELLESVRRIEAWSRQPCAVTLAVTKEADPRGLAGRQGVSSTAVLLRLSLLPAKRRVEDATDRALHLDPDGVLRSEKDAAEKVELSLTQDANGVIRVRDWLSVVGVAVLKTPLTKPWDTAPDTGVSGPNAVSFSRLAARRRPPH